MVRFAVITSFFFVAAFATAHPSSGPRFAPRQAFGGSYTTSSVSSSYQSLSSQIRQVTQQIGSGQISTQVASQEIQRLSSQVSSTFQQFNNCQVCLNNGINSVTPYASSVLADLNSLIQTSRNVYGNSQAQSIFGPAFGSLSGVLNQSFNNFRQAGVSLNNIIPQGFASNLNLINLGSTSSYLNQFGIN